MLVSFEATTDYTMPSTKGENSKVRNKAPYLKMVSEGARDHQGKIPQCPPFPPTWRDEGTARSWRRLAAWDRPQGTLGSTSCVFLAQADTPIGAARTQSLVSFL